MREIWERVAEPSEGLVHFTAPGVLDAATLCGRTDWLGCPACDGVPSKKAVTCRGCLALVRYVLERGLPHELKKTE